MYDFSHFKDQSEKVLEWIKHETGRIRTGRASPQLVEDIKVDSYGTPAPLNTIASISIENAKTLVIQPWDKTILPAIDKAISESNIGIQPIASGDIIRLILPELTGERKEMLSKLAREKLEEAKVRLRQVRHEVWEDMQQKEKEKEISEDDKFRLKDELQKKMDDMTKKLEDIADRKIEEIKL